MNMKMVAFVLGKIMLVEAALMTLPLGVTLLCREADVAAFVIPIALLLVCGLALGLRQPKRTALYAKDGFAIVALAWMVMSLFGALPLMISGSVTSFVDAFFETVSGFTTTGATIFTDVETLGRGILFWRSFTHWVGGMGVLVFVMAVLPMSDGHGMHLLRAEVPGPTVGKLVSRMSDTAKILYGIYLVMTVIEIILLCCGGMPLFDSCIHSFGSAGTGGFSNRNLSIGAYGSSYIEIVVGIFMLLFGVNFNLYYFLLIGRVRDALRSDELRAYLLIVGVAVGSIAINIMHMYENFGVSLRHAFFQVSTIITTTGFSSVDFNLWPTFSKMILVTLMFIGACAGSTGGGIKVARVVILAKTSAHDMQGMVHPNAVTTVRFEDKALEEKMIRSVHHFICVYLIVFVLSTLLLSLDGFDLVTTFTAVASCLNNIGPGLEIVGPMGNFAGFSDFSKLLLSADMLMGRLELFPILLLFAPSVWVRRGNRRRRLPD